MGAHHVGRCFSRICRTFSKSRPLFSFLLQDLTFCPEFPKSHLPCREAPLRVPVCREMQIRPILRAQQGTALLQSPTLGITRTCRVSCTWRRKQTTHLQEICRTTCLCCPSLNSSKTGNCKLSAHNLPLGPSLQHSEAAASQSKCASNILTQLIGQEILEWKERKGMDI